MSHLLITIALGVAIALVANTFWRRWRRAQQTAQHQLAMLQFDEMLTKLQNDFLKAASATGKPRGLRWKRCDLGSARCFAKDLDTRELIALVGATIRFEAIKGGDMEDVEAVDNLRFATAIFVYRKSEWTTDGRVVFNLEPAQALERFGETLLPV